ncbi:MAG: DUF512 domain-containing protein, partial [Clostridia bacterium]|nr:DUF512 domain-containing protein [Clostridia bacterium]
HPGGRTVSIATGVAAYDSILSLSSRIAQMSGGMLRVFVYKIINNFFGESITVSGLLTGSDMKEQLMGRELGDELLIPANTLKADEDVFLDDMTPYELSLKLEVPVRASSDSGAGFIRAVLGI